jgi:hypothetical protein
MYDVEAKNNKTEREWVGVVGGRGKFRKSTSLVSPGRLLEVFAREHCASRGEFT